MRYDFDFAFLQPLSKNTQAAKSGRFSDGRSSEDRLLITFTVTSDDTPQDLMRMAREEISALASIRHIDGVASLSRELERAVQELRDKFRRELKAVSEPLCVFLYFHAFGKVGDGLNDW
jgi:hypothetical protein